MRPDIGQNTAGDFIYRVPSDKWFVDFSCIASYTCGEGRYGMLSATTRPLLSGN